MRNETGHKVYRALGYLTGTFDFENARKRPDRFRSQDAGVSNNEATVAGLNMSTSRTAREGRGAPMTLRRPMVYHTSLAPFPRQA
jgi:hypothetical protein